MATGRIMDFEQPRNQVFTEAASKYAKEFVNQFMVPNCAGGSITEFMQKVLEAGATLERELAGMPDIQDPDDRIDF